MLSQSGCKRLRNGTKRIDKSNKLGEDLAVEGSKPRRDWREAELKHAAQVEPSITSLNSPPSSSDFQFGASAEQHERALISPTGTQVCNAPLARQR